MRRKGKVALAAAVGMVLPFITQAQDDEGLTGKVKSLHSVLDQLYKDMIPMCSQLIGVGSGLAGFAALFYIAVRVWKHIANAESIDFYPLFKPFVTGFAILNFNFCIDIINGILQPTVDGTGAMVKTSDRAIEVLLERKAEAIKKTDFWQMYVGENGEGDSDKWYKYYHPKDPNRVEESFWEGIKNELGFALDKAGYNFRNSIREWMAEVLQLLFQAAALCINTIRTFNLIVLAVLGPIAFGLSVFDGFQHTLKHWLARYINVFLWLPVANIFAAIIGKTQENMLKIDLEKIEQFGDAVFGRTDTGYLIFLVIGIIGYFTVPSVASYIMWVGGGDALTMKTTKMAGGAASMAGAAGGAVVNRAEHGAHNLINTPGYIAEGYQQGGSGAGFASMAGTAFGKTSHYLRNKLSGDSS
jgi:conjugative transposon TraJ protein